MQYCISFFISPSTSLSSSTSVKEISYPNLSSISLRTFSLQSTLYEFSLDISSCFASCSSIMLLSSKFNFSLILCIACACFAAWLVLITPFSPASATILIVVKINKIIIAIMIVISVIPFIIF